MHPAKLHVMNIYWFTIIITWFTFTRQQRNNVLVMVAAIVD